MGLTLVLWDPFLSFLSVDLINTHDIGHTSVYGLEIALHSLQLLNRALLYMWYFNPPPSEEVFLRLLHSQMNSYGPGIARSSTLRCSNIVCWTMRASMTTSSSSAAACWHTPVPRLQPSRRLHRSRQGPKLAHPVESKLATWYRQCSPAVLVHRHH